MQNLLTSQQIRDADAHTISIRNISSLNLMETASIAFVKEFEKDVNDINIPISIYCGNGNNGSDGLAVARLLQQDGYTSINVKIARLSKRSSLEFDSNFNRLKLTKIPIIELTVLTRMSHEESEVIIDALLGSGLNKLVEGELKTLIEHINTSKKRVISIDVPSGFPTEGAIPADATIVKSALAISFQRPKINFFFPESAEIIENFKSVPIGLDEEYIQTLSNHWKLIEAKDIKSILNPRKRFSHKGTYGHALIVAGSKETMGAALLCADGCLHSGAGLTTACIPDNGFSALNSRAPEIMILQRSYDIPISMLSKFSAIAIGPGLDTDEQAVKLLQTILINYIKPVVLDADALNILSNNPGLLKQLPAMSVLTPHMKEFDRMFGEQNSWWERVETARKKAAQFNVIILLKNQYSFIVLPDGNVLINPTGNPAMAVGGMGDILTGMIAAFLAQGYSPQEAAMIACFIHGKAGDE